MNLLSAARRRCAEARLNAAVFVDGCIKSTGHLGRPAGHSNRATPSFHADLLTHFALVKDCPTGLESEVVLPEPPNSKPVDDDGIFFADYTKRSLWYVLKLFRYPIFTARRSVARCIIILL